MFKNIKKEEALLLAFSFWVTIALVRTFLFVATIWHEHDPRIVIDNIYIHHYIIGVFLIFVVGMSFLVSKSRKNFFQLLGIGIGTALVTDEFSFLWTFSSKDYWSITQSDYWSVTNLLAIIAVGLFLTSTIRFAQDAQKRAESILQHQKHNNHEHPLVSVVIPAFNEEKFLAQTLQSILRQNFRGFELIVVDNNSSDKTSEIAQSFGAKVLFEPCQGVGYARQKGFAEAKGEIIATTDADTLVPPFWLSKIVKEFEGNKNLVAFGGLYNFYSGSMFSRFVVRYFIGLFWTFDRLLSSSWPLPGVNFAVLRTAFLKAGGFHISLSIGEDVDLSLRMKNFGKVALDPNFRVLTSGRRFSRGLLRGLSSYAPNTIARWVFRKQKFLSLSALRSETSPSFRSNLFPLVFMAVFLFALFYNANPVISHAKGVRPIKPIVKQVKIAGIEIKEYGKHLFDFRRRP